MLRKVKPADGKLGLRFEPLARSWAVSREPESIQMLIPMLALGV
jgi:hypothetical protein